MAQGLTRREIKTKNAIQDFIKENGVAPTIRELGKALNVKSANTVYFALKRLENKGHIRKGEKGTSRNIILCDACPACGKEPDVLKD